MGFHYQSEVQTQGPGSLEALAISIPQPALQANTSSYPSQRQMGHCLKRILPVPPGDEATQRNTPSTLGGGQLAWLLFLRTNGLWN